PRVEHHHRAQRVQRGRFISHAHASSGKRGTGLREFKMKRRKKKKLQEGRQGVADEEQDQTNNGSDDEWTEEEDETMTDRDDREYKDQEEIEILEDKEITEAYDGSPEAAASAAAVGAASPGPQSISPELDYDLIPEPGRSTYFKHDRDDSAPEDEESRDVADRGMEAEWAEVE